jgi:hypothetical protein
MGKANNFIINFCVFLVGIISISVGRIMNTLPSNLIDESLSFVLKICGFIIIFALFFMWGRSLGKSKM